MIVEDHCNQPDGEHQACDDAPAQFEPHREERDLLAEALALADDVISHVTTTDVTFRAITAAEIDAYLATEEPFDKAGAYAIQEHGELLVAEISGSFSNVVGLPVEELKNYTAWKDRMLARPAVRRVLEREQNVLVAA